MVLLLHLINCDNLEYESILHVKPLLDQTFELVGNRVSQGFVISSNALAEKSKGRSEKASVIYCFLGRLRARVMGRAAWKEDHDHDGVRCAITNLPEALQRVATEEWTKKVTSSSSSAIPAPETQEVLSVPPEMTDITNPEEWNGLMEEFLQSDMIE